MTDITDATQPVTVRTAALLTWDWRGQPDIDELRDVLAELGVYLADVATGTDQYAIVVSDTPITDLEQRRYWDDYSDDGTTRWYW